MCGRHFETPGVSMCQWTSIFDVSGKFLMKTKEKVKKKEQNQPKLAISPENSSHVTTYFHINLNVWGLLRSLDNEIK